MVEIEGGGDAEFQKYVWVLVEEQDAENWSLSGLLLTAEAVREIRGKLS